jgi:hypothetical protein
MPNAKQSDLGCPLFTFGDRGALRDGILVVAQPERRGYNTAMSRFIAHLLLPRIMCPVAPGCV